MLYELICAVLFSVHNAAYACCRSYELICAPYSMLNSVVTCVNLHKLVTLHGVHSRVLCTNCME